MTEIHRVVRGAAWRLGVSRFLVGLTVALTAGVGVAIVFRVLEQFGVFGVDWARFAWIAGAACPIVALVWAIVLRPGRAVVARRVDEGADLKDALATALTLEGRSDGWALATVETARRAARGVRLSAAVPVRGPRLWYVPLAGGVVLALVFMLLPRTDALGFLAKKDAAENDRVQIITAKQEVDKAKEKVEEMAKQLGLEEKKPEAQPASDLPQPMKPEDVRREALRDLTSLKDRLTQMTEGPKGQKLDQVRQQLKQLQNPGEATADLSKALAAGNFAQAKAEIQKLAEKAKAGGADSKAAAKQLEQIAKQLEQMAKNQQKLEEQLKAAGMDPNLAKDPAAAKEAIKNNPNLSQQQKDQLSQACDAQSASQQATQGLSESISQMAQAMAAQQQSGQQSGQQSSQQAQAAAQQMAEQLSQLEQMSQEMQLAEAALSECKSAMGEIAGQCQGGGEGLGEFASSGNGTSPWREGWSQQKGGGQGGPGQGQGGAAGSAKADFDTELKKSIGARGQGPIVSSRVVEGESIRGESKAEFVAAVARGEQNATEAIENNAVPREFHESIKAYFGRLKQRAAPASGGSAPADKPASAEPAPSEPAKDADKK